MVGPQKRPVSYPDQRKNLERRQRGERRSDLPPGGLKGLLYRFLGSDKRSSGDRRVWPDKRAARGSKDPGKQKTFGKSR